MNNMLRGYLLLTIILCALAVRAQMVLPPPVNSTPAAKDLSRMAIPAVQNLSPRYSPDGKWVAFIRGSSQDDARELWVMHSDGTRPTKLISLDEVARKALQEYRRIYKGVEQDILSPSTIRYMEWLSTSDALICGASAPNGRTEIIFIVSHRGHLTLIANPLMFCRSGIAGFGKNPPLLISPDRKRLTIIGDGAFFTVDTANPLQGNDEFGEAFMPTGYMRGDAGIVQAEATGNGCWGSDGLWYFADAKGNLCSLSPQGHLQFIIWNKEDKTPPQICATPALSHDGKWLAYLCDGKLVQRELATGNETLLVPEGVSFFRWLADGRLMVVTQEAVKSPGVPSAVITSVIRVFSDGIAKNSMRIRGTIRPDASPDGRRMVFEEEGSLFLMDIAKE